MAKSPFSAKIWGRQAIGWRALAKSQSDEEWDSLIQLSFKFMDSKRPSTEGLSEDVEVMEEVNLRALMSLN